MGTNFYMETQDACPHCGHSPSNCEKHIGKSSLGWVFALHVYPEEGIHSLEDWVKHWDGKVIRNEYGEIYSQKAMLDWITKRSRRDGKPLRRTSPNASHCLGPGPGTWDLFIGEFS